MTKVNPARYPSRAGKYPMAPSIRVGLLACALAATSATARAEDAAAVAAAMTSEETECGYVLQLGRQAQRAEERLRVGRGVRCGTELFMRRRAATEATRVVEAKRGKTPTCFRDPACDFVERTKLGK